MRQRDRESTFDSDPHDLFFGHEDDDTDDSQLDADERGDGDDYPHHDADQLDDERDVVLHRGHRDAARPSRVERRRHSRKRRNRRFVLILATMLVLVVGVSAWLIGMPIYHYLHPADYSGKGTGTVVVKVNANDDAHQIGQTLHDQGVVASVRAFTNAASDNSKAKNIQPGSYRLHRHMSAKQALALMLNPASRANSDVVVTEGATVVDVAKRLTAPRCSANASPGTVCGLGLDKAQVTKALENVKALGLPTDYTSGGKVPASAEGFLYPATYAFDDKTGVTDALGQMVVQFTEAVRSTNFTASARALRITPYQELIIASIAQAEAKFPADYPKVARVILNHLAAHIPLKVDATSAYAAKLKGLDPTKVIYSQTAGPFNTYNHLGLPPTPIGNPGAEALNGASHPTPGNWLYYVNADAAGHLFFTNSETAFEKAAAKCKANHWGCG